MEESSSVIDLSGKKLRKLTKPSLKEAQATTLILDDNELQRLDNIDSYLKLQKLSAIRNQLLRMYGVCRLHCLQTLNLSHNGILTIEGLKELVNLKWLSLAGNNIKTIEHLNSNINLEYIDLSENSITHINDLSFIRNLKELYLHNNKINHLRQCDRFLPDSLATLTLANNNITDLNEISQLAHLKNLTSISFANNPCVNITGGSIGFDYRPFIINWCMSVNVIDGYMVGAIESLRAEWLYSQGRGRQFRIGEHNALVQYLAHTCPLTGEALETEEDRKLRLILSKAQHHQQQLREEQLNPEMATPSPTTKKKLLSKRSSSSSKHSKSPNRMSSSCYTPVSAGSQRLPRSPDRMTSSCIVQSSSNYHRLKSPDRTNANCYSPKMSSRVSRSPDRSTSSNCYSPNLSSRTPKSPDRSISGYYNSLSRAAKTPDPSSVGYYSSGLQRRSNSPDRTISPSRMSSSCYNIGSLANSLANQTIDGGMLRRNSTSKLHYNSGSSGSYNGQNNPDNKIYLNSSTPNESQRLAVPEHYSNLEYRPMSYIDHHFTNSSNGITHHRSSSNKGSPPIVRSPKPTRSAPPGRTKSVSSDIRKSHSPSPSRQRRFSNSSIASKREVLSRSSTIRKSPSNSEDETESYSSIYESPPLRENYYPQPISAELKHQKNMHEKIEKAAILIQKNWRGYYTRNKNKEVQDIFRTIQAQRANQYLQKLANDMESAKVALESERKIQMLQTEAISALWRKVSALQGNTFGINMLGGASMPYDNFMMTNFASGDNSDVVRRLAATCTVLQGQIEQLQNSMQDIVKVMTVFSQNMTLSGQFKETGIATQTEIIAVHTPQGDGSKIFPFQKHSRPSSLPLAVSSSRKDESQNNMVNSELKEFAGTLVEGVIKTISEHKAEGNTVAVGNTNDKIKENNVKKETMDNKSEEKRE